MATSICKQCSIEIKQKTTTRVQNFCSRTCSNLFRSQHIVGKKYGSYTLVLKKNSTHFVMQCECGNIREYFSSLFAKSPYPKCSACAVKISELPEYRTWADMIQRCTNPKTKFYSIYGKAGIKVSPFWRDSFTQFLKDVGFKPTQKHQLDRIDRNGNYEPGNVRWATPSENTRNRRGGVFVSFQGKNDVPFADVLDTMKIPHKRGYQIVQSIFKWNYQKYVSLLENFIGPLPS